MTEIPDDIFMIAFPYALKAAETACRNLDYADQTVEVRSIQREISRAVMAERERWQAAVDRHVDWITRDDIVAAAIRGGAVA